MVVDLDGPRKTTAESNNKRQRPSPTDLGDPDVPLSKWLWWRVVREATEEQVGRKRNRPRKSYRAKPGHDPDCRSEEEPFCEGAARVEPASFRKTASKRSPKGRRRSDYPVTETLERRID